MITIMKSFAIIFLAAFALSCFACPVPPPDILIPKSCHPWQAGIAYQHVGHAYFGAQCSPVVFVVSPVDYGACVDVALPTDPLPIAASMLAVSPYGTSISGRSSLPTTTKTTTLGNGGTSAPLAVQSIIITGPQAASFSLTGTCMELPFLAPGQYCEFRVKFSPQFIGNHAASLDYVTNATYQPARSIALTGKAVQ